MIISLIADREQYDITQTPPLTPVSSHSLPNSIQSNPQVHPIEPPEPRRNPRLDQTKVGN